MVDIKKCFYTTILSQTISSDGKYLFCGSNFGEILVYSIDRIVTCSETVTHDADKLPTEPQLVFPLPEKCQVYSLSFHKDFLIVGLNGEICGYHWNGKNGTIGKRTWTVKLPASTEYTDINEVNYLWLDKENEVLYAGCGDNVMYAVSLEDGRVIRQYQGHKDYIHCVSGSAGKIATASEDGTVLLWDSRQTTFTGKIEPHTNQALNRSEFGKWQGTVSITEDWLVCGGGPRFSLWHLRSLECTTDFAFPDRLHVSGFIDDAIYAGGDCRNLYQYSFNGDVTAEIPLSTPAVYSVVQQTEPNRFMAIAGAASQIDVCTNFSYRDIVLNAYKK
ncbi:AAEL006547-PA [Aedes aegypti]|uniref:WD40-repeat protein n=2 Tax=Aedes aegypti TaxID=7159 RepID=Q1HQN6_AEDAE|nr:THO complex subunit 6 [Aedes aegypti]ABF18441.1 WD40-repeat protein [Aedes aegypti]EAT41857.1 AAEL006547-PA [Aedes aegypti]